MCDVGKDGTPKYSVGGRVKELATDKTPAPGAYSPEKTAPLGEKKAPSYTMGMSMMWLYLVFMRALLLILSLPLRLCTQVQAYE